MSGDVLAIVPAGITCLFQVVQFFVYNERDYKKDIDELEKANKSAEAAALESFSESKIATSSYEAGDDPGLRDKYLEFVHTIHKHTQLDIELATYRRGYVRTSGATVSIFILALLSGVGSAIALLMMGSFPPMVFIPILCWSSLLLLGSISCIVILRGYIKKLDIMKQRGDIVL